MSELILCKCCGRGIDKNEKFFKFHPTCPECEEKTLTPERNFHRALDELFRVRKDYYRIMAVMLAYFPEIGDETKDSWEILENIFSKLGLTPRVL